MYQQKIYYYLIHDLKISRDAHTGEARFHFMRNPFRLCKCDYLTTFKYPWQCLCGSRNINGK